MEKRFVLSTIGISILLRMAEDSEQRDLLNRISNESQASAEVLKVVETLVARVKNRLQTGNVKTIRELSAELNGLYGLYEENLALGRDDAHWLIASDTVLGRKTAEVIQNFLATKGLTQVQVYCPKRLSTASTTEFADGIQDLIEWCENTVPDFQSSGYEVIFNLTGGFKSLQGYLNIIGMFYADEIVYIFEGSPELIRIPRLPIQVDSKAINNYAVALAMMEHDHIFSPDEVSGLPEGLLYFLDANHVTLSNWGRLIWLREKNKIFQQGLLPFPRLVYTRGFKKDFERAEGQEKIQLQDTLAKVAHILEEDGGSTARLKQDNGLKYDNYVNTYDDQNRPIGHFRISRGIRVSCITEDGKLYLRMYGKEPDVNTKETN